MAKEEYFIKKSLNESKNGFLTNSKNGGKRKKTTITGLSVSTQGEVVKDTGPTGSSDNGSTEP